MQKSSPTIREATITGYKHSLSTLLDSIDFSRVKDLIRCRYPSLVYNRGRKPHAPIAMLKAFIVKELIQISSRRKLANFLKKNVYWIKKCGFRSPPHHDCFSEFIKRLGKDIFILVFNELVRQLKEMNAFIGNFIAIDSTLFKAYSHPQKGKQASDPDARWGIGSKKEWVFGYKLHVACDADSELPLSFEVTPANRYDSTQYRTHLKDLIKKNIKFRYVLADAGYDTKENREITEIIGAIPVIPVNPRRLGKEHSMKNDLMPCYKKRCSVERVFSRLKEGLGLKMLKVRELQKVVVHVAISLIAMLSVAVTAIMIGRRDFVNSISLFSF